MNSIRVRYPPSPTGLQHLGNLRTALFNWLFARQNSGTFILRFEDTDRNRLVTDAESYIEESLKWLGLDWDEGVDKGGEFGPYRQSERLEIYQKYAQELLEKGRVYRDWTSAEKLEELRRQAQINKQPLVIRQELLETEGDLQKPHVMRFKIDESMKVSWQDAVFGDLNFDSKTLDDFVAIKSDGFPTYNFANVIDDHLMQISHVLRGNEYLPSTPKYLQVYEALGWKPPKSAHLPQVLGPDKTKLSKRHGALGALEYRDAGYLPDAILNFLATLGWNDGSEQEIFTKDELIQKFSLSRIQKSPAIFDKDRLDYLNSQHIRRLSIAELAKLAEPYWPTEASRVQPDLRARILEVEQDRIKRLSDLKDLPNYFFKSKPTNNLTVLKQRFAPDAEDIDLKDWLKKVIELIEQTKVTQKESLMEELKTQVHAYKGKTAVLFSVLRVILCNDEPKTPPIWEVIYILGKAESIRRLKLAL